MISTYLECVPKYLDSKIIGIEKRETKNRDESDETQSEYLLWLRVETISSSKIALTKFLQKSRGENFFEITTVHCGIMIVFKNFVKTTFSVFTNESYRKLISRNKSQETVDFCFSTHLWITERISWNQRRLDVFTIFSSECKYSVFSPSLLWIQNISWNRWLE